jgi:hypothetical protein
MKDSRRRGGGATAIISNQKDTQEYQPQRSLGQTNNGKMLHFAE